MTDLLWSNWKRCHSRKSGRFQQLSKCTACPCVVAFRACKQASIIYGRTRVSPAHAVTSECAEPLHNISIRHEQGREAKDADQVALQIIYNIIYNCWCNDGSVLPTAACHNGEPSMHRRDVRGKEISEEGHIKAALYQMYLKPFLSHL